MDELEISGKRYISTRRAAREHGYHSDYMGQLIRAGRVAGQKVGRAWYIDEASLAVYLGKAPQPAPASAPEPVSAPVAAAAQEPTVEAVAQAPQVQELGVEQKEEISVAEVPVVKEPEPTVVVPQEPVVVPGQPEPVEVKKHQEPVATPIVEREVATPIRIHTPPTETNSGLRYEADDAPTLPVIVRMPRVQHAPHIHQQTGAADYRTAPRSWPFPFVSLSVVGVVALMGALFVSQFVSATVVSEPGKTATVQYAIHW